MALRYLRDARGQTVLILAAVSVGVSVIVFVSSLINGLQASLIDKTLGSQPHVTLQVPREVPRPLVAATDEWSVARRIQSAPQRLRSIDQWPEVIAKVSRIGGVTAVSPTVTGPGFALRSDAKNPIVVRGVDPERFLSIIDLRRRLIAGRFEVGGGDVVIGSSLAADLGVGVGDKLRIQTVEGAEDVVTVAGVFTLGNEGIDRTWVITSLRHGQSLFKLAGGVTTIELKVLDIFSAERVAEEARDHTGLRADSWMKLNAELLAGLSAQSGSKTMIEVFVIVAVALGIASVLIVSVVQKSREIGILRAFGTPSRRILNVFLLQGGLLGLTGSFFGSALGALFAKAFESVARAADGSPKFPVLLDLPLFLSAAAIATGVGLAAAVIPARRAARLDPATAIQHG
jgi:lipoprotein-releasing system permease protein